MVDIKKIVDTKIRRTLIESSIPPVERFVNEMEDVDSGIELAHLFNIDPSQKKMTSIHFYEQYCEWATINREKLYSKNAITKMIPQDRVKDSGQHKCEVSTIECGTTHKKASRVRWISFM